MSMLLTKKRGGEWSGRLGPGNTVNTLWIQDTVELLGWWVGHPHAGRVTHPSSKGTEAPARGTFLDLALRTSSLACSLACSSVCYTPNSIRSTLLPQISPSCCTPSLITLYCSATWDRNLYLSKENKNTNLKRYSHAHCSIIYNSNLTVHQWTNR